MRCPGNQSARPVRQSGGGRGASSRTRREDAAKITRAGTRSKAGPDFALSDARGGDPISLAAYLAGLSQTEASRNLAEMLRVASSPTSTRTRSSIPCHLTSVRGANTVHALARKTNTHRASLFRKTRPTPIGINCDRRKPRRTDQKTPRQWPAPAVAERPRRTPPPSILPRSPTCRRYASDGSRTAGGREAADWVARTRSARTVMPALPRHT